MAEPHADASATGHQKRLSQSGQLGPRVLPPARPNLRSTADGTTSPVRPPQPPPPARQSSDLPSSAAGKRASPSAQAQQVLAQEIHSAVLAGRAGLRPVSAVLGSPPELARARSPPPASAQQPQVGLWGIKSPPPVPQSRPLPRAGVARGAAIGRAPSAPVHHMAQGAPQSPTMGALGSPPLVRSGSGSSGSAHWQQQQQQQQRDVGWAPAGRPSSLPQNRMAPGERAELLSIAPVLLPASDIIAQPAPLPANPMRPPDFLLSASGSSGTPSAPTSPGQSAAEADIIPSPTGDAHARGLLDDADYEPSGALPAVPPPPHTTAPAPPHVPPTRPHLSRTQSMNQMQSAHTHHHLPSSPLPETPAVPSVSAPPQEPQSQWPQAAATPPPLPAQPAPQRPPKPPSAPKPVRPARMPQSPRAAQGAPPPQVALMQEADMEGMLFTLGECTTPAQVVELFAGDDAERAEEAGRAAGLKAVNVVVCGQGACKDLWLAKYLGYRHARSPAGDLLKRKVLMPDKEVVQLHFAIAEDQPLFGLTDSTWRWGQAFVFVWSVDSPESFETVKRLHREITREKDSSVLPMILVMYSDANQPEETWKVSREDAASLSDTLNVPLCEAKTHGAIHKDVVEMVHNFIRAERGEQDQATRARGVDLSSQNATELEFVVLGDVFVGKTTLIRRAVESSPALHSYSATSAKSVSKCSCVRSCERFNIKLIDTPGTFFEQALLKHTSACKSVIELAADEAVLWLKAESLLNVHGFVLVFSFTAKQSFEFAIALRRAIRTALLDMPTRDRDPVTLVLGTKKDMLNTSVQKLQAFETATRMGCLFDAVSPVSMTQEQVKQLFAKLGLLYSSRAQIAIDPIGDMDRHGYLMKGRDQAKYQRKYFALHDGFLSYGPDERTAPEARIAIGEDVVVEQLESCPTWFVIKTAAEKLYLMASSAAEKEAWMASLQANLLAVDLASEVIGDFVKAEAWTAISEVAAATGGTHNLEEAQRYLLDDSVACSLSMPIGMGSPPQSPLPHRSASALIEELKRGDRGSGIFDRKKLDAFLFKKK
eukprot:m51a1_g3198 hypothetical protein (1051) ;mRNA; r:453117-457518